MKREERKIEGCGTSWHRKNGNIMKVGALWFLMPISCVGRYTNEKHVQYSC